ncbi:MAG TPA: OmpA family protein [Phycisphaerae bacterium]|nr:OmpA family protein [Phycisphaerae bacterium]HRY67651.1 OmpA family protein [Phycisphaerae bacterium]HSA25038.1 OmpA family protein [Phycisphaerae bacterium]
MSKKHQPEEHGESAPLWIVSFADLVTLMLSFFVILAAANPKESGVGSDPGLEEIAAAVRAAFSDMSPDALENIKPTSKFEDLLKQLKALARRNEPRNRGDSKEEGIYGDQFRVRRVRDGMEITMGGPVFFEPFSAQVNPKTLTTIQEMGRMLKGHRNMIEVRGHAGDEPRPADWKFTDAVELSYQRAKNVADELIKLGANPKAIRITAAGPNEPVAHGPDQASRVGENRRVEILIRESLIDDYRTQAATRPY